MQLMNLEKCCSGVTLTNYDMKDTIKLIRTLENRGTLLKRLLEKLVAEKED